MASYAEKLSYERRFIILRFLTDSPERTSNGEIIVNVCNSFGIKTSHDQFVGELAWLKESSMLTYKDHNGFIIVTATKRGVDIARGRATHDLIISPESEV